MKNSEYKKMIYIDQVNVSQWTAAPLRIRSAVIINASPDLIFPMLSDPKMMCQVFSWIESVTVIPMTEGEAQDAGALRTCILDNGLVLEEEIVDWQPPHGYVCRGIDATHPFGMRGHVSVISLALDKGGCQFIWQHYFDHSNVSAMRVQLAQSMESTVESLLHRFGGLSLSTSR